MTIDDAAEALYGAPLKQFVEERKRLAADLKAAGDKAAAAAVAKLARPGMSAWVVNQLWREARKDMEALFAAGAKLRGGDFGAGAAQRAALQSLRNKAVEVLKSDGHAPSDGTLLRVQKTLQALSAIGGFEPDEPGRLVEDRDPPGFEVLGGVTTEVKKAPDPESGKGTGKGTEAGTKEREQRREEEQRRKTVRVDLDRAMKVLERAKHAVRVAEGEVAEQAERMARVEKEAEKARQDLAEVERLVESIQKKL
jgi:hypothetical protein